jgi:hypothetical protein
MKYNEISSKIMSILSNDVQSSKSTKGYKITKKECYQLLTLLLFCKIILSICLYYIGLWTKRQKFYEVYNEETN